MRIEKGASREGRPASLRHGRREPRYQVGVRPPEHIHVNARRAELEAIEPPMLVPFPTGLGRFGEWLDLIGDRVSAVIVYADAKIKVYRKYIRKKNHRPAPPFVSFIGETVTANTEKIPNNENG